MRTFYGLLLISIPIGLCAQVDSLRTNREYDSLHLIVRQMMNRDALGGLREMHVDVVVTDTSLRTEIVNRLRSHGIPFVTRYIEALHQLGSPTLSVDLVKSREGRNLYRVTVELSEDVKLVRNETQMLHVVTWSTERFVEDNRNHKRARDAVLDAIDEFVKAYQDANRQR